MLLPQVVHLVFHDIIIKCNPILITLILTIYYSLIRIEISLAELFSPVAVNVDAKLTKQQLYEAC